MPCGVSQSAEPLAATICSAKRWPKLSQLQAAPDQKADTADRDHDEDCGPEKLRASKAVEMVGLELLVRSAELWIACDHSDVKRGRLLSEPVQQIRERFCIDMRVSRELTLNVRSPIGTSGAI